MARLASTIEAILYLKAQPLKIAQLAEFARCDKESAEEGLIELMGEYAHREGALEIAETEDGYALQLREVFKPLVDTIVPLDIGLGALRTLAAIALRGPIAQNELVELRGSGVYQHVPDLVEQGFVKKRRQSDGRSSWLQITEKFYQHFEIDKLPEISNLALPTPVKGAAAKPSSEAAEGSEEGGEAVSADGAVDETVSTDETLTESSITDAPSPEGQLEEDSSGAQPEGQSEGDVENLSEDVSESSAEAAPSQDDEVAGPDPISEEIAVLSGSVAPSGGSLLSDEAIAQAAEELDSEASEA